MRCRNPDGLRNQTEGGILQRMSRALVEEVTWDNKRITSVDWETYNSLHLDYEMPTVETFFVTPAMCPQPGRERRQSQSPLLRLETPSSMQLAPVCGICRLLPNE